MKSRQAQVIWMLAGLLGLMGPVLVMPAVSQNATPPPLQIVPTPTPPPTQPPIPSGLEATTFTDPTFGWSVSWDDSVWTSFLDGDALELTTRTSDGLGWQLAFTTVTGVRNESWPLVETNRPESCLIEMEAREAEQQYGPGNVPLRDVSKDRAWGVYSGTESGREVAYYIECRAIPSLGAMLVMLGTGSYDSFNEVAPLIQDVIHGVTIPSRGAGGTCDHAADIQTDEAGLRILLPDPSLVPGDFDDGTDFAADFATVVGAIGGNRQAQQNLLDWGWTANVSRSFANTQPREGSTDALLVSIHGFRDSAAAAEALLYFSDFTVSTGWSDVDAPTVCESSRMLVGTDENGIEMVSVYVQSGPVLYRIVGLAPAGGDPTSTVLDLTAEMFGTEAGEESAITEERAPQGPTIPTPESGRNEFANVIEALRETGLQDVNPGRYTATVSQLEQPGQVIEIGQINAFVFIYPDADPAAAVASREADAADLDSETLVLISRQAERPLNEGEESHIFQKSNVTVVLVGGDDEVVATVQDAVESLP